MKLYSIKTLSALAVVLSLALTVSVARAEEIEATVDTSASVSPSPTNRPGPGMLHAQINTNSGDHPLQKMAEERKQMVQGIRQTAQGEIKDIRDDRKQEIASTTENFKREAKDLKAAVKLKMEAREFAIRKDALVKMLNQALTNLDNIITRIQSRITKAEGEGRDMSEPKALLVTAQQKIAQARVDVTTFSNITATSTTSTSSGTTTAEVDLIKPRKLGDFAIKSVKDARNALQKVVVSIAHNMGLKLGNATSTVDVDASSTVSH